MADNPASAVHRDVSGTAAGGGDAAVPEWFADFLIDRSTRKPSPHTVKAYRQDFHAIATHVAGGASASLTAAEITVDAMRRAFAHYAQTHEPASIRRCWSTWNVLCDFLFTAGQIGSNPMPLVGRPKAAHTLPRALPHTAIAALLDALHADAASTRRTDWYERDLALILTALLTGLRSAELRSADVGAVRTSPTGAVLHVHGKGNKDRSVPVEPALLSVLEAYLDNRARRFPHAVKPAAASGLSRWPASAPLFVGRDGARITRGALESRVRRAFRRAGPDAQPVRGAMVHGLRHTFATELAEAEISVYTLMKLLGHESMATSQRYVTGAARETRSAAARNPLYEVIGEQLAGSGES